MPTWSPDGTSIAFISERGQDGATELWRIDVASGQKEKVASFDGKVASPSWSSDGKQIALRLVEYLPLTLMGSRFDEGIASDLVLVPVDGGEPVRLQAGEDVFPFRPAWTRQSHLLYTADGQIRRLALETRARERIGFRAKVEFQRPSYRRRRIRFPPPDERLPVRGIVRPVVSPDGSRIAFTALGDIWIAPSDGGAVTLLTRDEYLDSDPSWSPDGRYLVFASDRAGTLDLWIKDVESSPQSGVRRLTEYDGAELAPAWSPDGKWIAYLDESYDVYIADAEGEKPPQRIYEAHRGAGIPSWSSDSRHLAFAVHEPFSTRYREGFNRILVISIESKDSRILSLPEKSFGSRDGDGPAWSPDGSKMALAMDGGIWVVPVDPSGEPSAAPRKIADETADFLSWWPDSKRLLYLSSDELRQLDSVTGQSRALPLPLEYEVSSSGGTLLVTGVRLIDGTGAAPREDVDILITGNRIEAIEPSGSPPSDDARVIDAKGKTVIPGLIEAHTHLNLPEWGSRHGRLWLAYGVTSIRTMTEATYRVLEERESIASGRRIGPRVFVTGFSLDGDRIYYKGGLSIEDEDELQTELGRALRLDYDLIKTYVRLPDTLQKLAVEKAHQHGVFVTSHEIYPAVAYGIDGIEHLRGTSRRGFSPKLTELRRSYRDVIDLLTRSGVYFTPTLLIQGGFRLAIAREPELLEERRLKALYPDWEWRNFSSWEVRPVAERGEVVKPLLATIGAVSKAGGNVLAGTDSPIVPYGLGLILEIEMLSEAGLGPLEAIRCATQVAAEALGAADDLGTLEPGKLADLVILSKDPSEDIRNLRSAEKVILDGRLVTVNQLLHRAKAGNERE
jgi:Tol biopolymer transport system component/imidazolonepropionase-like amidohydrolase